MDINKVLDFSGRLKSLRIKKGLKQKEVAEATGITAATYNRYEKGLSNPKAGNVLKIANFFGVSPEYLLLGDDKQAIKKLDDMMNPLKELTPSVENIKNYSNLFDVVLPDILNLINEKMPTYDLKTGKKFIFNVKNFKDFPIEQQSKILSTVIEKVLFSATTITIVYKENKQGD